MRPERESPDTPRCGECGRFMETHACKDRLVVYRCCGREITRFRPQFTQAAERLQ